MTNKIAVLIQFKKLINDYGGNYSEWYIGVTSDLEQRLSDHNIDKRRDLYNYVECESTEAAREIEEHFLQLGVSGGPGGGDEYARIVYIYKKNTNTKE